MKNASFNFEQLHVYQRSLTFSQTIYTLTQTLPREHLFGLTDQLRRAALSIPLNIAEGSSRTKKDFRHFLLIARGSCFECVPLFHIAESFKLITAKQNELFYNELLSISQMISALATSLK